MDSLDPSTPLVRAIGYAAGVLTTLAFIPQVIKTWHTRSARDLSLAWLFAFGLGVALWLTYGILLREPPIILANIVTLGLILALIWMRARPPREQR